MAAITVGQEVCIREGGNLQPFGNHPLIHRCSSSALGPQYSILTPGEIMKNTTLFSSEQLILTCDWGAIIHSFYRALRKAPV